MSEKKKLNVIRLLSKKPMTIKELVDETSISKTTVYRIRTLLQNEGSIHENGGHRIMLTTKGRLKYSEYLDS